MRLSPEEAQEFIRLHQSMLFYVNQRLKLTEEPAPTLEAYKDLPHRVRFPVHEALPEHPELIDAFAEENPFHFDEAELEVVRSWKHNVHGTFYAFRPLKSYMVFLSATEPVVAYGVVGLTDPLEVLLGPDLPRMVKTTLLPFRGRIVYGGFMTAYNVILGPGIRRSLNEGYKEARATRGIITTLPPPPGPPPGAAVGTRSGKASKKAAAPRTGAAQARAARDDVVAIIDDVCRRHLSDEYAAMGRKLADVLARKRPSPLTRGKPESWAGAIVRVIGWVNWIDDPGNPDHLRLFDIDKLFGISEATGSAKSMAIREMLRIRRFDPEWTLPSRMDDNPMAWMIEVNGLIADARRLPREIQEEAYRRGLIPYIPGDQSGD